jgi:hypothetical protein
VDNSFYFFTIFLLSNAPLERFTAAKTPASPRWPKPRPWRPSTLMNLRGLVMIFSTFDRTSEVHSHPLRFRQMLINLAQTRINEHKHA